MSEEDSILVSCLGPVAWVRINGGANHESAGCVRQFLWGRFEEGMRQFVVDLEACRGIDSTFIGMLYCFAAELEAAEASGRLELINPGERNARSISKLGLDSLIHLDSEGAKWQEEQALIKQNLSKPLSCAPLDKRETTELILDAHEALIEANEANRSRFCDVVDFLKQDLAAQVSGK